MHDLQAANAALAAALSNYVALIENGIDSTTIKYPMWLGIHINEAAQQARAALALNSQSKG